MNGGITKRILLALIPVALLSTASLALTGLNQQPVFVTASPAGAPTPVASEDAPPHFMTINPQIVAQQYQQPPQTQPQQQAPAQTQQQQPPPATETTQPETTPVAEEPMPEFVVDKTPLQQAMAEIDLAIERAKLSVTALDGGSQSKYIQETMNYLVGSEGSAGVNPLLTQARVNREAAETQWIAALQRRVEASNQAATQVAQSGTSAEGTVQPPAQPFDLAGSLGPDAILGSRGVRVEEQASEVVGQAIKRAQEALRMTGSPDEAALMMQSVVSRLEVAKKIIQIALDR